MKRIMMRLLLSLSASLLMLPGLTQISAQDNNSETVGELCTRYQAGDDRDEIQGEDWWHGCVRDHGGNAACLVSSIDSPGGCQTPATEPEPEEPVTDPDPATETVLQYCRRTDSANVDTCVKSRGDIGSRLHVDWIALLPVNVPSSPAAGSSGSAASPSTTIASLIQSIIYGYFDHSVSVSGPANNQPLTGAGIGNPDVVAYGVLSATDVWGWVPPDTRVCFLGRTGGGVVFLDSAAMPRQPSWLPHYRLGNDTCVDIPGAGIVVLVTAQGPSAIADVADPAPQQPAPQVAGLQLSGCTLITRNILNLRAGPGTDTAVLQEIPYLTRLAASGRAGQWFSVSYGGQAGWVHGDFAQKHGECLAPSPAAEQPPMPAEGQTISDCLLITNYILNLREGPGVNYGVLHKIPYLTRLPASGRMGLWFNVVYAGRSGWVHDDYVQRQGNCV